MRQFKFRAWDIKEKIMHYPAYPSWNGCIIVKADGYPGQRHLHNYADEEPMLMQYTGLKDSKRTKEFPEGQEIYEADIVTAYKQIGLVVFRNAMYLIDWYKNGKVDYDSYLYRCKDIEVIGSVHQNPELLEGSVEE